MCWIAKVNAGNPTPYDYIDEAQKLNNDGYGVSWFDGSIKTFKTMDYAEFKAHLKTIEGKLQVIHLRITSAGKTDITNVHPFQVPTGVMFHNGTISCLKPGYGKTCDYSDTNILAQVLSQTKYEKITDLELLIKVIIGDTLNKLVFLNHDGTVNIFNQNLGIDDENGNWYSNSYHIKENTHKVFVYGTLKKGFSNHYWHLGSAEDVFPFASTVKKYAMIVKTGYVYPYILGEHDQGHRILGEVYEVTDSQLTRLDLLEGNPTHYRRELVEIENDENPGEIIKAWMYIKATVTVTDLQEDFIEDFEKPKIDHYRYNKYTGELE